MAFALIGGFDDEDDDDNDDDRRSRAGLPRYRTSPQIDIPVRRC